MFLKERDKTPQKKASLSSVRPSQLADAEVLDTVLSRTDVHDSAIIPSAASSVSNAETTVSDEETVWAWLRLEYGERIKPEKSNIPSRTLDEGTQAVKDAVRKIIAECIALAKEKMQSGELPVISEENLAALGERLFSYQFGLGPIDYIFKSPNNGVEDVVITTRKSPNGEVVADVWTVGRFGRRRENITVDAQEMLNIINRHLTRGGKVVNMANPIVDGRLMNDARVAVLLYPLVDPLYRITIRIPTFVARRMSDLIELGTISEDAAGFLALAVRSGLSIVVGGSTGAGKTNLLQALCNYIPKQASVVAIEDTRELNIPCDFVSYFQTGYQFQDGKIYTQKDLAIAAMRHLPEQIVFGEVRDGAAWVAVKLANTGHSCMLTVHADSAENIVLRLVYLARESDDVKAMTNEDIIAQITSGYQIFAYIRRIREEDGRITRVIQSIVESPGLFRDGKPVLNRIYQYDFSKKRLMATGVRPHEKTIERMVEKGIPADIIQKTLAGEIRFTELDEYLKTTMA